jgi:hypothetical protein
MPKQRLRDEEIAKAERGEQPSSYAEAYGKYNPAKAFEQSEKTQARMVDATEEEIKTIAAGERHFREHMKKKK